MKNIQFYANSDGATADLVYDDVAMTASGVLVHVPAGAPTVIVNAMIGGQPISETYPGGTDTTFAFPSPLPISFKTNWKGGQGLDMPWLGSVGVSVEGR